MYPGQDFSIPLSRKMAIILRSSTLANPLTPGALPSVWTPWRRAAIYLSESRRNPDEFPRFDEIDPLAILCQELNVPDTATVPDLVSVLLEALRTSITTWQAPYVRQRLQLVNSMHCEIMEVHQGEPNLQVYEGASHVVGFNRAGEPVRVAAVTPKGLFRRGTERLRTETSDGVELHPLVRSLAQAVWGHESEARFDRIETGPFGVRAGILGWNTRAYNLGALFSSIFAKVPDLYHTPETVLYTDKMGRPCNFYGWLISSNELSSPQSLVSLLALVGAPEHRDAQIIRANSDVMTFEKETGIRYVSALSNAITKLFLGFVYLDNAEWHEVLSVLKEGEGSRHERVQASIGGVKDKLCDLGMTEMVEAVWSRL